MKEQLKINSKLFLIGSVGYSLVEIAWRGFTHWTMSLTGGICFTAIYYLNGRCRNKPILERGLIGSAVITGAEFIVGCVVNRMLHWDVWDYSRMRFNLLGQICPLYSILWFFLSIPLCWFSGRLSDYFGMVSPCLRHVNPSTNGKPFQIQKGYRNPKTTNRIRSAALERYRFIHSSSKGAAD